MVVDGENRPDTAIKNIWHILDCSVVSTFSIYFRNWTQKEATRIPFASTVWSFNDVRTVSSRDKPNKYCRKNGHVKVKIPSEKKKTTKVSQWSVSVYGSIYVIGRLWKHIQTSRWVLYRVIDSNKGWAKKKDAICRRDKHTNTVWMMCMSISIYGNVPDPLRMYIRKDCLKIT